MKKIRGYLYDNKSKKIYIYGFIVFLFDYYIKLFIKNNFFIDQSVEVIKGFFYITYCKNYGIAWSMLAGKQIISIIVAMIILVYIYCEIKKLKIIDKFDIIGYSLLTGGIIGNLIDRIFRGYVIDYLDFYIFNYNYPVFNFADICIVIGVIIIVFFKKGDK